jgi:cysteine synthase/biotin carboxylase
VRHAHIVDAIGHTSLVRLRLPQTPAVEVYAKLELQNLFGMKDRVARNIIREARRLGRLTDGAPIVESSSGTMALGVALVGRSLGHPVHIVTDPRIDDITLAKLRALGCEVHIVEAMTAHGWQSARLERLEELLAELPGAFWPEQYSNPDNPGAYRELAAELLADLGTFDALVGSVGSGGSLCGTARALRRELPSLRVVGVDCVGSSLFGQPDRPHRRQSGLGNSLVPKNLDRRLLDEVHWLNDREAFTATHVLAAEQQIFGGNTSGSVYRVLTDVAARMPAGSRIVGILPDRGDRYAGTVYDEAQLAELAELPLAERPDQIDYGTVAERWSRAAVPPPPQRPHLLFVEANTSGTGMLALTTAGDLGLTPVLVTGSPERYRGLAETGAEVLPADTNDLAALRTAVQDRFRRDELAGVTTTSDFYVPAAAELAAWLGLPGSPVGAAVTCRDKALLRQALDRAGVCQPRFWVVEPGDDVGKAVAAVGLPCVVKPVDDSGSNGVLWCATEEDAAAQIERLRAVRFNVRGMPAARHVLIEEYAAGPELSVEMSGERCLGVTAKTVGPLPWFVELRHVFPAPLPASVTGPVVETVRQALRAVGWRLGATHTEVRLTADGPAVIEINPRPAGGMIPELIRRATGTDVVADQLRAAAGLPLAPPPAGPVRSAGIQFLVADREGVLDSISGPGVTATAVAGQPVRPPRNAYDRLGHVIVEADTADEVVAALDEALAQAEVRIT